MRVVDISKLPDSMRDGIRKVQEEQPQDQGDVLPLGTAIRLWATFYGSASRGVEITSFAQAVSVIVDMAKVEAYFDEEALIRVMRTHGTPFERHLAEAWREASSAEKQLLRKSFNERLEIYRPHAIAASVADKRRER